MDTRFEVGTSLGPVWFHGRDTGRPILLVISGAFAEENLFWKAQQAFPAADMLRAHLPGNHCPPLAETSIRAFVAAFDEALATRWPGRPLVVLGLSVGGIVALGLRSSDVRAVVAMEPPLLTDGVWPFELYRTQTPAGGETFVWNVLGVGPDRIEPRDHSWVLDGLTSPTLVLVGDDALMPRRVFSRLPSLISEATRQRLAAHSRIVIETMTGAGHNIPRDATLQHQLAVLGVWNAALPGHPIPNDPA